MIEIREINRRYRLFIDGRLVQKAKIFNTGGKSDISTRAIGIYASDRATSDRLAKHSFSEYSPIIIIELVPSKGWLKTVYRVSVEVGQKEKGCTIGYHLGFEFRVGNEYPFIAYHIQMERLAKAMPTLGASVSPPSESAEVLRRKRELYRKISCFPGLEDCRGNCAKLSFASSISSRG